MLGFADFSAGFSDGDSGVGGSVCGGEDEGISEVELSEGGISGRGESRE